MTIIGYNCLYFAIIDYNLLLPENDDHKYDDDPNDLSGVRCHVLGVRCQVSGVKCQVFFFCIVLEIAGGGSHTVGSPI